MKAIATIDNRAGKMSVESPLAATFDAITNIVTVHTMMIRMQTAGNGRPQMNKSSRFRSFSRSVMVFVLDVAKVMDS